MVYCRGNTAPLSLWASQRELSATPDILCLKLRPLLGVAKDSSLSISPGRCVHGVLSRVTVRTRENDRAAAVRNGVLLCANPCAVRAARSDTNSVLLPTA